MVLAEWEESSRFSIRCCARISHLWMSSLLPSSSSIVRDHRVARGPGFVNLCHTCRRDMFLRVVLGEAPSRRDVGTIGLFWGFGFLDWISMKLDSNGSILYRGCKLDG